MSALLTRQDDNTVVVVEVVRKLSRTMPVSVTSHPVETGSSVSDHAIRENKKFTLEGVISDASFSIRDLFSGENTYSASDAVVKIQDFPPPSGSTVVRTNRPNVGSGLTAGSGITSRLKSLAGEHLGFITQFTRDPIKVDVSVPTPPSLSGYNPTYAITDATYKRAEFEYRVLEGWRDERVVLTLTHSSGIFTDCIITDIQVDKEASVSNRSFVFTMQLEQIQIVDKAEMVAIAKRKKPKVTIKKPAAAVKDQCVPRTEPGKQPTTDLTPDEFKAKAEKLKRAAEAGNVTNLITAAIDFFG